MARKDPTATRSIKLPGGGQPQRPPQPQRPTQQQRGPAAAPNSDVGRAMADLDASAQIRDRSQLPNKVKVITPQVIMNIVQGITSKIGMDGAIDRDEFNQLVMAQTQNEMRLQQSQEKINNYQAEYKKLYEAFQNQQMLVQQAQKGQAGAEQYQAQIAELNQRTNQAVDTYMELQQQLDNITEQYGALEAALSQRDQDVAQLEQQVMEAQQGGAAATEAQTEIEHLQKQLAEMDQQLAQMENASAEASEGVNAVARERDELNGQVTALQSEVEELRALKDEVEKLKRELKQGERSHAKVQNIELELEKLRTAEGSWLEEKRRLAAQLSNETNNRREAEQKLKAIEMGETLPEASKAVEQRATKAEAQAAQARKEVETLEKQLQKAQAGASKAEQAGGEAAKLKADLDKTKAELKQLHDDLGKAGNAAKELGMLKRKFENIETELEGLRSAEGKWLEEKRRMAEQLSNETNLRRELEKNLKGEVDEAKAETSAVKKKLKK
jgi:chromosome segregation ATPase